ncbi:lysylphosphatidylglycerol synthase transmembrane domain-containing protein [Halovenus halobia]|uniref:lysylphosphatidylglycerol synthase transmembrane domain-containing protein n=1 Tax=Halovenus halobia TaxID=3396622 RepID=UPI003F5514B2
MGTPAGERKRLFTQRRLSLLGTVLVVVVGCAIAVRTVDVDEVIDAIRVADPRLVLAAVFVYTLSWPVRGHRYGEILDSIGHRCGQRFLTAAVFVSQLANLVVPARAGDGVRAYLLKTRRDVPYATGAASLTVERLFDLLALACLGAFAAGWLAVEGSGLPVGRSVPVILAAGVVAGVAVCCSLLVVVLARSDLELGRRLQTWADGSGLSKAVDAVVSFGADVRVVAADPRAIGRIGAGSLAVWVLDVLTAVLVLQAITDQLAPTALLAVGTLAVTVGNLSKVLPLSQGGIGLYEAAFTALVVAVSPVTPATALAAAVVDHALKNGVTVLGGAASGLLLNLSPSVVGNQSGSREPESSNL